MAGRIHRVTMFKIPGADAQKKLIEAYTKMGQDSKKDGKPYILNLTAGQVLEDPRNQGFTVASKTEFASLDDMKFYDDHDEAHATLKAAAKGFGIQGGPAGVMTVFFKADATL